MVRAESFSEVGGHRVNEDAFAVQQHPDDPDLWLCFVADGQGGQAGGGPAARLACQAASDAARACSPAGLGLSSVWSGLLQEADVAVAADPVAGFTTLLGLGVSSGRVVGASSGDSAALVLCGEKALELTAAQHKNPPVGSGAAVAVPFAAALRLPWQVLAMSDGVWKYIGWDGIVEAARRQRGASLIAQLQRLARLPGSGQFPDDFTIVVLEGCAK
jgi:serine/threonine protein phosphatase PrpC